MGMRPTEKQTLASLVCVGAKEKPRNMMGYNRASFKLLFPLKKLASPKYDSSPYSKNQRNEIFQIAGFLPKKKSYCLPSHQESLPCDSSNP